MKSETKEKARKQMLEELAEWLRPTPPDPAEGWVSVKETAEVLGVSSKYASQLWRKKELAGEAEWVRHGGYKYWRKIDKKKRAGDDDKK